MSAIAKKVGFLCAGGVSARQRYLSTRIAWNKDIRDRSEEYIDHPAVLPKTRRNLLKSIGMCEASITLDAEELMGAQ